jgi:hypothetical protein
MNETNTLTIDVPSDVHAFAREQHVERYLPTLIESGERWFPGTQLRLSLEEDPEIENLKHIVLIVEGLDMEGQEFLDANDNYRRSLFAVIPAPLICHFRLGLDESRA